METGNETLIIHAAGTVKATTLSLTLSAKFSAGVAIRAPSTDLVPDDIQIFNLKRLEPIPNMVSMISGQPAIIYRRGKLEIALAPIELIRMVLRDLRASEVEALRDRFGDFEEIMLPPQDVDPEEPRRISTWRGLLGRIRVLASR